MASTLLEQFLEHLSRTALQPPSPESPQPPSDMTEPRLEAELDRVAGELLSEVDASLSSFARRAVLLDSLRRLPPSPPSLRHKLSERLADAARHVLADSPEGAASSPPGGSSQNPARRWLEEEIGELRDLLKQLHDASGRDRSAVTTTRDSEPSEPPAPAAARIPLDDIQKMIEFLK